jgi:hypothetical protein
VLACLVRPGDTGAAMADRAGVRNQVVRKVLAAFDDGFRPDIEWYPIETDRRPDIGIETA